MSLLFPIDQFNASLVKKVILFLFVLKNTDDFHLQSTHIIVITNQNKLNEYKNATREIEKLNVKHFKMIPLPF